MITKETVQEYLSRGGTITKYPPHLLREPKPKTPTNPYAPRPQNRVSCSWEKYLAQLINDDTTGCYCAFSLITPAPLEVLLRTLHSRCIRATNIHNPKPCSRLHRSELRKWKRREIADRGSMVFLLPAISSAGTQHFHGLVRTPREFSHALLTMNHYCEGKKVRVIVPQEVTFVLGRIRRDNAGNDILRNINIHTHRTLWSLPVDDERASLLHLDADARTSVLAYYTKTSDGEVRDFNNAHFVPHIIRKALPLANTTLERRVA